MQLTLASIRRPVFISMVWLAIIIMGVLGWRAMPREATPDVDFPMVTIVTVYAGAGPREVENLVSEPIEEAVAGVPGLKHINSISRDGLSVVYIEFELGTDLDAAAADVRDKVNGARNSLPSEASEPAISKLNITGGPIMTIAVNGPQPSTVLRKIAETTIKDAFSRVKGAGAVYVDGGNVREIHVSVDKARLQAYGISLSQVVSAINTTNLNIPGGTVKETGEEFSVRMVGEFTSVDQIQNVRLVVPSKAPQGLPSVVRLGDVATVTDTIKEPDRITRLGVGSREPEEAVVMAVAKQSGGNTVVTADGVKEEMARLLGKVYDAKADKVRDWTPADGPKPQRILPNGMDMVITMDDSEYVRHSLEDVNRTLVEGIVLVVLIVFVFLHSARATFIVAMAIPASLISTFLPLNAAGFTLNFMTLLALSLAIGILVDDSIVVLENIERHLRKGEEPAEAALNGRSEIGLAAITITMVDVVVFLPIANMGGIVGQFFRPFGWAVAIATLLSLFVSFTLTPMLASRFFEKGHGSNKETATGFFAALFRKFDRFYDSLDTAYERLLAWTLDNRALTIWTGWATLFAVIAMTMSWDSAPGRPPMKAVVLGLSLLMIAVGAFFSKDRLAALYIAAGLAAVTAVSHLPIGFEFIPNADRGTFSATVEGPTGQALAVTDRALQQVARRIQGLKDPKSGRDLVEYVVVTTGATSSGASQGSGNTGSHYGNISVKLVDKADRSESLDQVMRRATIATADVPAGTITIGTQSLGPMGKPIRMEVVGPDMDENVRVANAALARMKQVPGVRDADITWKPGKPELQIVVDQRRAADKAMVPAQVGMAIRTALEGSGETGSDTKYREGGEEYTIRVQYDKLDRSNAEEVGNLIIGNYNGKPVLVKDVASIVRSAAPTSITRLDRQRLVAVESYVLPGYLQGDVQSAVTQALADLPTGSARIQVGGTGQLMQESFQYMVSALLLAVLLVYMLMAALFESLTTPFVIWLSLPQAMIGALLGLMITNKSFSIVSMIGIIMLTGLVTKNGILLLDYTNTLRSRGKNRRDAILEAGPTRLRPVMMTTFAMVFGMLPTAMAISKGSEQRQPMAIAVIGGLILSTLLTLLVIPATYDVMDDLVGGVSRGWRSLMGRRARMEAPAEVVAEVKS